MAEFTRKKLKEIFEAAEIEVPKDVLGQICDLHTASNDDLVEKVNTLTSQLATAEQERDAFKARVPKDGAETVTKEEYDKIKTEYDAFKTEVTQKEAKAAKEKAVRELFKEIGISEKRMDSVIKVTDLEHIKLDKEGKIEDSDKLKESAKTEWADFIETVSTQGANTANPPYNNGKGTGKTREEILSIKNSTERRSEMAKNMHLFPELATK